MELLYGTHYIPIMLSDIVHFSAKLSTMIIIYYQRVIKVSLKDRSCSFVNKRCAASSAPRVIALNAREIDDRHVFLIDDRHVLLIDPYI